MKKRPVSDGDKMKLSGRAKGLSQRSKMLMWKGKGLKWNKNDTMEKAERANVENSGLSGGKKVLNVEVKQLCAPLNVNT